MKSIIYISGILGGTLLFVRLIGVFSDNYQNSILLYVGLFLLVFVFLPAYIADSYKQNKKIAEIIQSYKGKEKKNIELKRNKDHDTTGGIDQIPYRPTKSGLTWGGGNIHGANATRGTKRSFLK